MALGGSTTRGGTAASGASGTFGGPAGGSRAPRTSPLRQIQNHRWQSAAQPAPARATPLRGCPSLSPARVAPADGPRALSDPPRTTRRPLRRRAAREWRGGGRRAASSGARKSSIISRRPTRASSRDWRIAKPIVVDLVDRIPRRRRRWRNRHSAGRAGITGLTCADRAAARDCAAGWWACGPTAVDRACRTRRRGTRGNHRAPWCLQTGRAFWSSVWSRSSSHAAGIGREVVTARGLAVDGRGPAVDGRGRDEPSRGGRGVGGLQAQQLLDSPDHQGWLNRFLDHSIGAAGAQLRLVDGFKRAAQQQHGHVLRLRLALDEPRQVVAVDLRQGRPRQHDVGPIHHHAVHGLVAIGRRHHAHRLLRERQRNHSLNGDVVVGE